MLGKLGDNRWAHWLAPSNRSLVAWFEAPALVILAAILGLLFKPEDPLLLTGSLRWMLLVPIVVALRYGSFLGALSMLTLMLAWFLFRAAGLYPGMAFPEFTYLGGLVIVLVAGEFSDMWRVRLQRAESRAAYTEERLKSLTQRHVLLRLSHDRLEENLLLRPYTVRDALLRLRDVMMEESHDEDLPAGEELLNLLADDCQLQRAVLYRVHHGDIDPRPVAMLGENKPLDTRDSLLRFTLENRVMSHVQMRDMDVAYTGFYWVCAPVMNSGEQMIGMVVVERMPFLSIHQETLQLFGLLLNFYADVVQHGPEVDHLIDVWPGMPAVFGRELVALANLSAAKKIDTTLILFTPDDSAQSRQIVEGLYRGRRNLDGYWWVDQESHQLMLLMPMTGPSSFESFLRRVEEWLAEDYAFASLAQAGVSYVHHSLDKRPVKAQIEEMLVEAGNG